MALVNLKEVKVTGSFSKGIRVVEESVKGGTTYTQRWTLWTDERYPENTILNVSGFLSAKANEYTAKDGTQKVGVDLSLNSPRIEVVTDAAPADQPWPTAQPGSAVDAWEGGDASVQF